MVRRLGERREHIRFDVTGQLWAALEIKERGVLRNLAAGGALIEARLPGGLTSAAAAEIALNDRVPGLQIVVRHLTPVSADPGDDRYLIGLEFVNVAPAVREGVDELVRTWAAPTA